MMTFRMRKNIARVLLPFVFVFFTMFPARHSEAFVGLVPLALTTVGVTGVSITALDLAGMAIALVGAGALLYMNYSAPDGSAVAVPLQDQNLAPAAIVPLPVGLPTTASLNTVDGYCALNYCNNGAANTFGAPDTICHDLVIANPSWFYSATQTRTVSITGNGNSGFACQFYSLSIGGDHWGLARNYWSHYGCPPGYAANGSTCVLSNSRLAQDNRQDWVRQGNAYSRYAGDLYGTVSAVPGTTITLNDSVSMVGTNSGGNPTSITAVANSDGSTTITQSTQKTDASGNTYVEVRTITLDSAGNLVSSSGSSVAGSLNPSLPANNGGATLVPGVPGTITPNPTSTATVNFPADYARAGEPAAAAAPLGVKLDTLHNDLLNFTVPVAVDPVASMDERISAMGTEPAVPQISWMPSVLAGAGTCHALVFNIDVVGGLLNGMTGASSIDICDKLDIIRQIFGYMIFMATSIYIFRTFMLSMKGAGV